ncbi:hypothetical protein ACGFWD_36430 [Streptomyces sp. NPDC048448]|uniref:hypothetical protein n=1 Tax=unclassified Streptomyces TaxID=2593676 RepID=UPI0033B259B5
MLLDVFVEILRSGSRAFRLEGGGEHLVTAFQQGIFGERVHADAVEDASSKALRL